jgi:U3 small nucleolar RNA-associated protein 20
VLIVFRFMTSQWSSHERLLLLLIPKLVSAGALRPPKESDKPAEMLGPKSHITRAAVQSFSALTDVLSSTTSPQWARIEPLAIQAWRYMDVLPPVLPAGDHASLETFRKPLVALLMAVSENTRELRLASVAGKALALISQIDLSKSDRISSGIPCTLVVAFGQNPSFLAGAHEYIKRAGADIFNDAEIQELSESLISTLLSSTGNVRRYSLCILDLLSKANVGTPSDTIRTATAVEEIPLLASNQRNLAMYVRKLGMDYPHHPKNSWERRIVPYYCFGTSSAPS